VENLSLSIDLSIWREISSHRAALTLSYRNLSCVIDIPVIFAVCGVKVIKCGASEPPPPPPPPPPSSSSSSSSPSSSCSSTWKEA